MISTLRLKSALIASFVHTIGCVCVAALAGALVFFVWYPHPYLDLAGGRDLFLLVVWVDLVCGPLLTAVLYNKEKPRLELFRDLGLVVVVQLAALVYGLYSVWLARPLYLVMEIDRFQVVSASELSVTQAEKEIESLTPSLHPRLFSGPITVGIREPRDSNERNKVLLEAAAGGRDYAQRPEFYIPYEGAIALSSLKRAKPIGTFLKKYPNYAAKLQTIAAKQGLDMEKLVFVPVMGRTDWVAILDSRGQVDKFLKGDGYQ
jgi:hypothetical protein